MGIVDHIMATPTASIKPALAPPPGIVSNFDDPPSQAYAIIIAIVFFLVSTTPFVLVRLYTRYYINQRLWWDDSSIVQIHCRGQVWLTPLSDSIVIAWLGLFGLTGVLVKLLQYGIGVDLWNVTAEDGARFTKFFGKFEIVARISMFFTKLSILLLFIRIFVPPQTRKTKIFYASWFVIWFNLLYCIALVLVVLLQCVNKQEIAGKTCIDTYALLVTASCINVISDLMMLMIPLAAVWNLHMPMRKKIGLSFVFAVGTTAVAASIARLGWQVLHARDHNRTIVLMKVGMLAIAEQVIGIIVGCMPVLPAFFRHVSHQLSHSDPSKAQRESWRTAFGSTSYVRKNARPKRKGDPYLLSTTDELEKGFPGQESFEVKGTTTIVEARRSSDTSTPTQTVEGLHGSPETNALVSRSIQIESHPRTMLEKNPVLSQPAHLRK